LLDIALRQKRDEIGQRKVTQSRNAVVTWRGDGLE